MYCYQSTVNLIRLIFYDIFLHHVVEVPNVYRICRRISSRSIFYIIISQEDWYTIMAKV